MNEKIGVDFDGINGLRKLIRAYIIAKVNFPNEKIKVFKSSSGKGFHLEIYKKVDFFEDIYWRSILNDDSKRLKISIIKKFLNKNAIFDITFDEKDGKKREEIDFEKYVEKYKEDFEQAKKYLIELKDTEFENKISEIYNKLVKEFFPNYYYVSIHFNDDKLLSLFDILEFRIRKSLLPEYKYEAISVENIEKINEIREALKKEIENKEILFFTKEL